MPGAPDNDTAGMEIINVPVRIHVFQKCCDYLQNYSGAGIYP
jgi:hypothetical protein